MLREGPTTAGLVVSKGEKITTAEGAESVEI